MLEAPVRHVSLLRRALIANALFSSLCAVVFVAGSQALAARFGIVAAELVSTGVGLIVFVAMILLVLAPRGGLRRWTLALAALIAGLDVLWVMTTPFSIGPYSPAGKSVFVAIAAVVALLAAVQIRALVGIVRGLRTVAS